MSNILIEANNISKIYDPDIFFKRGTNFRALNMIDFTLKEHDFVAIMGPSGSGKSTLLNCLSTLDQVSSGVVKIGGENVLNLNDVKLSTFRYQHLGFVFQNHNLIDSLSIFDNIATPIMLTKTNPKEIIKRVQELARTLNIAHLLNRKPDECSGGEKQRAAIARALINEPDILICDEPTGNLDSKNSHELLSLLKDLNQQGTTIVLVTHDSMIASYAKKLIYLQDGMIKQILERNNSSQREFFNEIINIITKDSLLELFDESFDDKVIENGQKSSVIKSDVVYNGKQVREAVYLVLSDQQLTLEERKCRLLYVDSQKIEYDNIFHDHVLFQLQDIDEITIGLVAVFKMVGIFSEYIYRTTLKIRVNDQIIDLKLENNDDLSPFFDLLNKNKIKINDPANIIGIYRQYPDNLLRHRYLQRQYKRFKKLYNFK